MTRLTARHNLRAKVSPLFFGERAEKHPAPVEGIGGQYVDGRNPERGERRRVRVGIGVGKQPPQGDKAERRRGVGERTRERDENFVFERDAFQIAADDRAVRH